MTSLYVSKLLPPTALSVEGLIVTDIQVYVYNTDITLLLYLLQIVYVYVSS